MEKTYYILQKEAYSIYPQVDCLSVFQAQQISSWKIFSGIKPKLSFRLKKKAKFTDVLSSTAGPFTDFLISSKVKEIIDSSLFKAHVRNHGYSFSGRTQQNVITTTQIYAKITNDKIGRDMDILTEKIADKFRMAR